MPQANINQTVRTVRVIQRRWETLTEAQKLQAVDYVLANWQDVPQTAQDLILPRLLAYLLDEVRDLRQAVNAIDDTLL